MEKVEKHLQNLNAVLYKFWQVIDNQVSSLSAGLSVNRSELRDRLVFQVSAGLKYVWKITTNHIWKSSCCWVELRGVTAYHIVLDYRVHVTRYEKSNTAALNQSNHLLNWYTDVKTNKKSWLWNSIIGLKSNNNNNKWKYLKHLFTLLHFLLAEILIVKFHNWPQVK